MKSFKSLLTLALVSGLSLGMVGCGPSIDVNPNQGGGGSDSGNTPSGGSGEAAALEYADGTVLRMATGYNSKQTGLFFDAETAGSGRGGP